MRRGSTAPGGSCPGSRCTSYATPAPVRGLLCVGRLVCSRPSCRLLAVPGRAVGFLCVLWFPASVALCGSLTAIVVCPWGVCAVSCFLLYWPCFVFRGWVLFLRGCFYRYNFVGRGCGVSNYKPVFILIFGMTSSRGGVPLYHIFSLLSYLKFGCCHTSN